MVVLLLVLAAPLLLVTLALALAALHPGARGALVVRAPHRLGASGSIAPPVRRTPAPHR